MLEILARVRVPHAPVLPDEVARKADIITGEGINYSLAAQNTGVRWIDGQPVYRRVFIVASGATPNTENTVLNMPEGWGFYGLVRLDGFLTTALPAEVRTPLQYYGGAGDYLGCRITADGRITERHGGADMNSRPMVFIIDYLSHAIGLTSWDGGTAAWDNGTTTWDQMTRGWDGGATQWDKVRR